MTDRVDLTKYSLTFPTQPEPQLSRDNLIRWLRDRFAFERRVIVVQGSDGAGKTTLLAQFAQAHPDRCFSFFVGADPWASSSRHFLAEMCNQMQKVVGSEVGEVDDGLSDSELKKLFVTFYSRAAREARRQKNPFYFIVDGLDWITQGYGKESILDLLPTSLPNGLFLLASSTPDLQLDFSHEPWPINLFSFSETKDYLGGLALNEKDYERVYAACEGLPGYLAQIRRELESGLSVEDVLRDLPEGFRQLLEREWKRFNIEDPDILDALTVMAYAEMSMSLVQLADVICAQMENLERNLIALPIVQTDPESHRIHFVTDAHRRFVADKLVGRRGRAEALLIQYCEQDVYSEPALDHLPILYRKSGRQDLLKRLVTVEYLTRTLQRRRDVDLLRRNARLVAQASFETEDWQSLCQYSLVSSIIRTLSTKSAAEAEVEAFLALGDFQQALELVYQAVLPEDQLQLLSRVGRYIKQQDAPIPDGVMSDLEHMVAEIEPTDVLRERLVAIGADLFYIHPRAAMELVEKTTGAAEGGRLMDRTLAVLSLRLADEADSAQQLRSHISDESLREFVRVSSPLVAQLTPGLLLTEASEIEDISGKLFLLRSWCNANRDNPASITVIREALEIMTSSSDYSPSMRHLRQFAEPLLACKGDEVKQAIERFDLLKDTAIDKPAQELVRLELLLSSVEAKESLDIASSRLYQIYYDLYSISELDTRCYCLARVLLVLPHILPDDSQVREEIEERLVKEYRLLLEDSADHWAITRRLLRALTNYKPEMAVRFADKLNTIDRRDFAYRAILRVYADRDAKEIDLSLVENVLGKISETNRRDAALLRVIAQSCEKEVLVQVPEAWRFMAKITEMQDPRGQCLAYAYASQVMASAGKNKTAEELFERMAQAWSKIDPKWEQMGIGLNLVSILAEHSSELAQKLLGKIKTERVATPLTEEVFAELYVGTIELAIRAFQDILKSQDSALYGERLIEAIRFIPSYTIQCQLIADLALVHDLSNRRQDFEKLVKDYVLELLESCEDAEAYARTVVRIAPCLFRYERNLMEDEIAQLSPSRQNEALGQVAVHLLTKRLPDDPVDLDSLNVKVEYVDVRRICDIIKQMNADHAVYAFIDHLIDALVHKDSRGRESCGLVEKQALKIARDLSEIIKSKLPDQKNIQHEGYQIAAQAAIAYLRASAAQRRGIRTSEQWERAAPSWEKIVEAAQDIPNAADRALVMSWIAEKIQGSIPGLATQLLEEAKTCVYKIPNLIDRGNRFCSIAEAWASVDDQESAKFLLSEAMSILGAWQWDRTRDQITGNILQLAHSLDPEFAASLTSFVDNPIIKLGMEKDVAMRDLRHRPDSIVGRPKDDDLGELLGQAAWQLLESLCSGKGIAQQEKIIGYWTHLAIDTEFDTASKITAWAIENTLARTKGRISAALEDTFWGLLDSLALIRLVGETLLLAEKRAKEADWRSPALPPRLELFLSGDQAEASTFLQQWLAENARSYVRIYDPYFTEADLDILKFLPSEIHVDILTLWKTQKGLSPGDRNVEQRYLKTWHDISHQRPPETHIHIVGTSKGDGPIHDRYVITEGSGASLGPSLEGLGRRDSTIHILNAEESTKVEQEFIIPLLLGSHRLWEGERLMITTFTL